MRKFIDSVKRGNLNRKRKLAILGRAIVALRLEPSEVSKYARQYLDKRLKYKLHYRNKAHSLYVRELKQYSSGGQNGKERVKVNSKCF